MYKKKLYIKQNLNLIFYFLVNITFKNIYIKMVSIIEDFEFIKPINQGKHYFKL
jgi:hypothetical protein